MGIILCQCVFRLLFVPRREGDLCRYFLVVPNGRERIGFFHKSYKANKILPGPKHCAGPVECQTATSMFRGTSKNFQECYFD